MSQDVDPRLRDMLDREAIRSVLHRFCRGIDRADVRLLEAVYHAGATEVHGDFSGLAADFCRRAVVSAPRRFERMRHDIGTIVIDLDGDVAYSEAYVSAGCVLRGQEGGNQHVTVLHGRYLDRFERRAGDWRIAHRVVVKDYRDVRLLQDPVEQYPLSQWGRDDLVYSFPERTGVGA